MTLYVLSMDYEHLSPFSRYKASQFRDFDCDLLGSFKVKSKVTIRKPIMTLYILAMDHELSPFSPYKAEKYRDLDFDLLVSLKVTSKVTTRKPIYDIYMLEIDHISLTITDIKRRNFVILILTFQDQGHH